MRECSRERWSGGVKIVELVPGRRVRGSEGEEGRWKSRRSWTGSPHPHRLTQVGGVAESPNQL